VLDTWQSNAGLPGTTPLFNGTGYALASNATLTNFDGTTPFSVAVWVNTASGAEQAFLSTLNASVGTFQGWEIQNSSANGFLFFLINNFPSNAITAAVSAPIGSGLHYLFVTYDGSRTAAGVKMYVDGTSRTVAALHDSLGATAASGLPVRFGARNNGTDELTGAMAFVQIFNFVLTSTQVSAFFANGPQLN
jgi:hypothetical protein